MIKSKERAESWRAALGVLHDPHAHPRRLVSLRGAGRLAQGCALRRLPVHRHLPAPGQREVRQAPALAQLRAKLTN